MKKGWKIAMAIDGVLLIVLFALMAWFNNRASVGVAALEDMGRFVVCFIAFQVALIVFLALIIAALVAYARRHRR